MTENGTMPTSMESASKRLNILLRFLVFIAFPPYIHSDCCVKDRRAGSFSRQKLSGTVTARSGGRILRRRQAPYRSGHSRDVFPGSGHTGFW